MKEKISNERREMIIARNRDRAQIATLISAVLVRCPYSLDCVDCDTDSPFFNDSCNFVNLHYELRKLADTLENMVKMENKLLQDYYE